MAKPAPRLEIAIFSYNRGAWLARCLASIARHAPGAILRIYDDHSDDPATQEVLAQSGAEVICPPPAGAGKHGGLYANMQRALDHAEGDFLFFLQEDMQLVRPVTDQDMAQIAALFDTDPGRAFLCPVFLKGLRRRRAARLLAPLPDQRAYGPPEGLNPAQRLAYFDVSIGHVARLRAAGWQFAASEHANVEQARARFSNMAQLADPFAFFCPEVPVFRQRGQTLAARLVARLRGAHPRGFADMSAADIAALTARPLSVLPVAEDFLTPEDPTLRRPFVYKDIRRYGWANLLHKAELALRR